jgi:hypothetical protein
MLSIGALLTVCTQCDGGYPCPECVATDGTTWELGCRREHLEKDLDDVLPGKAPQYGIGGGF